MLLKNSNKEVLLGNTEHLFFLKNQINLNKFFIEKSLYMFSEVDWVYFYYLPKPYQFMVYTYSQFIKWVVSDSSLHDFTLNSKQIDNLVNTNRLSEISPLKLTKKL
jgi:hypothetical protein